MTGECLFAIHFEPIQCGEDDNFVVQTLARQPFAIRSQCYRWHRVHGRIGNVLNINGNVPFPYPHTFVIGCGNESTIFVDKCDCIYSSQMTIIFLNNVTAANVPLKLRGKHFGEKQST